MKQDQQQQRNQQLPPVLLFASSKDRSDVKGISSGIPKRSTDSVEDVKGKRGDWHWKLWMKRASADLVALHDTLGEKVEVSQHKWEPETKVKPSAVERALKEMDLATPDQATMFLHHLMTKSQLVNKMMTTILLEGRGGNASKHSGNAECSAGLRAFFKALDRPESGKRRSDIEIEELSSQLSTVSKERNDLRSEVASSRENLAKLEEKTRGLESTARGLEEKLKKINETTPVKLPVIQSQTSPGRGIPVNQPQQDVDRREEKINRLADQVKRLKEAEENGKIAITDLEERIRILLTQVSKEKTAREEVEKLLKRAQEEVEASQCALHESQQSVLENRAKFEKMAEERNLEALAGPELEKSARLVKALESEVNVLRTKLEEANSRTEQFRQEAASMFQESLAAETVATKRISEVHESKHLLEQMIRELEYEITEYKDEISLLHSQLASFKRKEKDREGEDDDYDDSFEAVLRREMKAMKESYEARLEEMASQRQQLVRKQREEILKLMNDHHSTLLQADQKIRRLEASSGSR